ncbi:hypothetical protein H257_00201 [Aphanomyces astaci]|uniref:Uncharacterized protein n=1 Tax=Aphanomyces astaci TaxID=112090 RepID=W4HBN2_APHAT|nr:hypothetical protein H257_00201 [Aphanomyces astaci]ETV88669.1 hypothetical protein H257_00201 [Aphanomyces astaci]|eukprot:XP_009821069.1 hypothetical protein H257_00201 [Aphanomyces astaci]
MQMYLCLGSRHEGDIAYALSIIYAFLDSPREISGDICCDNKSIGSTNEEGDGTVFVQDTKSNVIPMEEVNDWDDVVESEFSERQPCGCQNSTNTLIMELQLKDLEIQRLKNQVAEVKARYRRDTRQLKREVEAIQSKCVNDEQLRQKQSRILKASIQKASATLSYFLARQPTQIPDV